MEIEAHEPRDGLLVVYDKRNGDAWLAMHSPLDLWDWT